MASSRRPKRSCVVGVGAMEISDDDDGFVVDHLKDVTNKKRSDRVVSKSTTETPPKSTVTDYLKKRHNGVKKRRFDLTSLPESQVVSTGRTIEKMKHWSGHWPALREFMQNTIDHLGLLDPVTGRLHSALHLDVASPGGVGDPTFRFLCGEQAVCTICVPSDDELIIDQMFTFPIAPRALDTGVPDTAKRTSDSAGGFGDGFKTAAVALLASAKDFESLEWLFNAEGQRIVWSFEGVTREAVGTFAECKVLSVRITRGELPLRSDGQDYTMRQVIKVKGIGKSFIHQAVPRLVVFWDVGATNILASNVRGGDFIAPASVQPLVAGGILGGNVKPEAGVYVRGIWVRKPLINGAIMSFFGNRLDVNGRDRNGVDDDALVAAVSFVFRHCSNTEYLASLLAPLRGSNNARRRSDKGSSWLLKSPQFLNRVFEWDKEFVLHEVLAVPKGAIFVSSKTTKSKDPKIKWASSFLEKHGAPLVPIEPGANRVLFEEVSEYALMERCVAFLKQDRKQAKSAGTVALLSKSFHKLLVFLGVVRGTSSGKVMFSAEVHVAFVYDGRVFLPEAPLTRELVTSVLNVCQCHLNGASEHFSALVQAVFETLPPGATRTLTETDIHAVVKRAKNVLKENASFLQHAERPNEDSKPPARTAEKKLPVVADTVGLIDLTNDSDEESGDQQHLSMGTSEDLKTQIERFARATTGCRKRKRGSSTEEAELEPIIPSSAFESDNAGQDTCIRPASELQTVIVDASLGGGVLLCDDEAASLIQRGVLSEETRVKLAALREMLRQAISMVQESIPSLETLLGRIRHGYDTANNDYEAFCDDRQIVVNLHSYMPKLGRASYARHATLLYDLVLTITHELAHFLEPRAGHGPVWRDTHMKMVMEVMSKLRSSHAVPVRSV